MTTAQMETRSQAQAKQATHEDDEIKPEDSASQAGRQSKVSAAPSKTSSVARQFALRQQKASLEAELALERERHELEIEELKLRQRMHEHDIKVQLAKISAEADATKVLSEVHQDQVRHSVHNEQSQGDGSVVEISKQHLNPAADTFVPNSRNAADAGTAGTTNLQQRAMIDILKLPAAQLKTFDGNCLEYWTFIRSFDDAVDSAHVDDSAKLTRLVQFCAGEARRVVECCLSMSPNIAYQRARQLLKQRFGDSFRISNAWVSKVTGGPSVGGSGALQEFADELSTCKETLSAMGCLGEVGNQDTLKKIVERLPAYLQIRFKREVRTIHTKHKRNPIFDEVVSFVVEAAAEANDPVYGNLATPYRHKTSSANQPRPLVHQPSGDRRTQVVSAATSIHDQGERQLASNTSTRCVVCGEFHKLFACQQFKSLSVSERIATVKRHKLCFNCLRAGHVAKDCGLRRTCSVDGCNKRHTKFLHLVQRNTTSPRTYEPPAQSTSTSPRETENLTSSTYSSTSVTSGIGAGTIALPVIPVIITNPSSRRCVSTYALLDSGSTSSFIVKSLVHAIGVPEESRSLMLTTIEGTTRIETTMVNIEVADVDQQATVKMSNVCTKESLPVDIRCLASVEDVSQWSHLKDVKLPRLHGLSEVGLLIGQDTPHALTPFEVVPCAAGTQGPYATRTVLGWTLNGPLRGHGGSYTAQVNFTQSSSPVEVQLENLWTLESVPDVTGDKQLSTEDRRTFELWEHSIQLIDGHYELPIPFRRRPPVLANNREMALCRLRSLQTKLQCNTELYDQYCVSMKDMIDKNYAELVTSDRSADDTQLQWYLPHHAVQNVNKPGKSRVVFDCSARYGGTSLNDNVMPGPDLTNWMIGVLIRFREEPVAMMADIEAMFHQVRVSAADRDCLRFLWYPNGDLCQDPMTYRMAVHLFGGVWSPSCCSFALRHTAEHNRHDFDEDTVSTVLSNFYVDDCLKSVATVEQAVHLAHQLMSLLNRGGFRLTKWVCNSSAVMSSIPEEHRRKQSHVCLGDNNSSPERALGVTWDTESDELTFAVVKTGGPATRRGVMSAVCSLFDPLGLVSPFTLPAKRIMQELCRKKINWDDKLPDAELNSWKKWTRDLLRLGEVRVNRCLKPSHLNIIVNTQLHHFSDASQYGYGVATYLRLTDITGQRSCQLLFAKSRLAPMKAVTIPRLELTAATLAVKVHRYVQSELDYPLNAAFFWTDSVIVLQYIRNDSKRFHTFVANRVALIRENSDPSQWRHIDSRSNPADDASRGLSVDELLGNKRWFSGPEFLMDDDDNWPSDPELIPLPDNDGEVKTQTIIYATMANSSGAVDKLLERRSSWYLTKKDVAWFLRFKQYLRATVSRESTPNMVLPLSVEELNEAELQIVRYIQQQHFAEEFRHVKVSSPPDINSVKTSRHSVKKSSPLYRLEPVKVSDDVLRVGGRLKSHPIILPKNHHVTRLIIRHFHAVSGHSGREHVLSLTRQQYWIIGARPAVRQVLKDCSFCRRHHPRLSGQRMADLPDDRITADNPPFTSTGVDVFGPFLVKRGRSELKRYGCLFTCLAIRAIHIEALESLETDSFIQALQRFICRRGQVRIIRCDNGTNFTGAARELTDSVARFNQNQINEFLRQKAIQWLFNPPAASHMGGVWERQIRTVRKVLATLMKEQLVNDESLNTLFCLVESIINGRPLTTVSDDPNDLTPLTPNHMLLLQPRDEGSPGVFDQKDSFCRRRWRQIQYLADVFWRRWQHEYLSTLQLRQKWLQSSRNLNVNDVVLIMDDTSPRNWWPLGRVLETHPGPDGLVRSVKLVSRSGTLTRPVHKLCLLEPVN